MVTRVQRWGNSLAVRIPKTFAAQTLLRQDAAVNMTVEDGKIVLTPVRARYTLEELLAGMTEENLHEEISTGPSVGAEAR